jgi:hypothetical protein
VNCTLGGESFVQLTGHVVIESDSSDTIQTTDGDCVLAWTIRETEAALVQDQSCELAGSANVSVNWTQGMLTLGPTVMGQAVGTTATACSASQQFTLARP